jgi:hypothetical protein
MLDRKLLKMRYHRRRVFAAPPFKSLSRRASALPGRLGGACGSLRTPGRMQSQKQSLESSDQHATPQPIGDSATVEDLLHRECERLVSQLRRRGAQLEQRLRSNAQHQIRLLERLLD